MVITFARSAFLALGWYRIFKSIMVVTVTAIVMITTICILSYIWKDADKFFIALCLFSTIPSFKMAMHNTLNEHPPIVFNLQISNTIWLHFTSMVIYPTRLRLTGFLHITDIQIIPTYRCLRYLQVDWISVLLIDDRDNVIRIPSKGQISIWTDNDQSILSQRTVLDTNIIQGSGWHCNKVQTYQPDLCP